MAQAVMATKAKETSSLIPPRVTTEAVQSCLFMKNLTTAAISNIAYTRDLCPMDCFQTVQFENINLRMFKEDCDNERVQFFCVSLKSAFDALEKEYLQSLAVCFYETDDSKAEHLMECYIFEYTYASESRQLIFCTETKGPNESKQTQCDITDIKEHTKSLMQFILVMTQSYPRLPASTYVTIRAYYNDNAPENYQAPNYAKGSTEMDYVAKSINLSPGFGVVNTPFHQLASYWFVNDIYDRKGIPMASQIPLPSANSQSLTSSKSDSSPVVTTPVKKIRCVCEIDANEELWKQAIIICKYCGEASHAACYGVRWRAANSGRLAHCCVSCAADYGCSSTDPMLLNSSQKYAKSVCLIRRALDFCGATLEKGVQTLYPMQLMTALRLSELNTHRLASQLASFGVLTPRGDIGLTTICEINPEQLGNNMDKIFIPSEHLPLRYTDKTSGAREQSPDVVGDLLDDMEMLNREGASNICRVVERTASEPDGIPADGIFKLYFDVLPRQEAADDELPLSGSHNPIDSLTTKKNTYDCDILSETDERDGEVTESDRRAKKRNAPNMLSTPTKMFKGRNSERVSK